MPEDKNKLELALKEINFCSELKVVVADGQIIAICKQIVQRPEKNGVKTQISIDEEIRR